MFTSTRDGILAKIYLMDSNGGNVRRAGTLPGRHGWPSFSPDNRKIVFDYSDDLLAETQIYIMNSDGSDPRRLTNSGSNAAPHFASDGRIVYSHALKQGPPFTAFYIIDMDGSQNAPYPIDAPGIGQVDEPAFGPGKTLAFANHQSVGGDFVQQIFTMTIGGAGAKQLTNAPENFRLPGWCPNGSKIAYVNTGAGFIGQPPRHAHDGLYMMNADGSNPIRIVEIDFSRTVGEPSSFGGIGPARELVGLSAAPSFNRDCRTLTFSVNLDGKQQVYVVDADGSKLRRLTQPPGENSHPSFSR